ncbi:hypothetical protein Plhal304r1_c018g0065481 [Plasmopara halstedii]
MRTSNSGYCARHNTVSKHFAPAEKDMDFETHLAGRLSAVIAFSWGTTVYFRIKVEVLILDLESS